MKFVLPPAPTGRAEHIALSVMVREGYPALRTSHQGWWKASGKVGDSEKELIARAKNGETEAFRQLVSSYKVYVFSLIRRQVQDPATAEDLAQDVFVRVYKGLSSFRAEAQFKTWLTRIAINTTHSYFSSREFKERNATDLLPHDTNELDRILHSDHDKSNDPHLAIFQIALQQLPVKSHEVISLCGLQELTYEEVASLLSIPVGTVRSRLHTARLQLREIMTSLLRRLNEEEE